MPAFHNPTVDTPGKNHCTAYSLMIFMVILYAGLLSIQPALGGDIYLYLETGRNFFINGLNLTQTDRYLFSRQDLNFGLYHEWASMYLAYACYAIGGWPFLYLLKSAAVMAAVYAPFALARRISFRSPVIPMLCTLAVYISAFRFDFRIDLITLLFTLYLLCLVLTLRRNNYQVGRWCILVPITFLIWVNLHPGFYLGLLIFGLSLQLDGYTYLIGSKKEFRSGYKSALLVFGCAVLCCFINPRGIDGFMYPLFLAVSGATATMRTYIPEWQSGLMNIHIPQVKGFIILSLLHSVIVGYYNIRTAKNKIIGTNEAYIDLLSVFFITIGMAGIRYIAISSFGMMVILVYVFNALSLMPEAKFTIRQLRLFSCVHIVLVILLVTPKIKMNLEIKRVSENYYDFLTPHDLADYIENHNVDTSRLYLHYRYGAYFIWRWHGNRKVFVHSFVQNPELFSEYIQAQLSVDGFNRVIEKYGIKAVVVPPDILKKFPIGRILKDNTMWREVYKDHLSVMYARGD